MSAFQKDHRSELVPMAVAALVAIVSVVALVLLDFGPGNSQGNADGMITASVLEHAGAIATPSVRPPDVAPPKTIAVSEPTAH
jgi:hypothetical protein